MCPMSEKSIPTGTPPIDELLLVHLKHSFEASDPVIYHLASAVMPMLNQPDEANRLFIDQIMVAMQVHLSLHQVREP